MSRARKIKKAARRWDYEFTLHNGQVTMASEFSESSWRHERLWQKREKQYSFLISAMFCPAPVKGAICRCCGLRYQPDFLFQKMPGIVRK